MAGKFSTISKLSLGQIWSFLSHPTVIPVWFRSFMSGGAFDSMRAVVGDVERHLFEQYRKDFLQNHTFFSEINRRFVNHRGSRTNCEGWPEFLYVLTRFKKPEVVMETGVFDGRSSAVILQALHDNKKGKLVSIDMPAYDTINESTHRMKDTVLPAGCQPGWMVPDYLRDRYELLLGDSKTLLPRALEKYKKIDIFLHDSLHTYEHQMFEYESAWPHLSKEGILLSDDVLWTAAFHRFSARQKRPYNVFQGLGIMKK